MLQPSPARHHHKGTDLQLPEDWPTAHRLVLPDSALLPSLRLLGPAGLECFRRWRHLLVRQSIARSRKKTQRKKKRSHAYAADVRMQRTHAFVSSFFEYRCVRGLCHDWPTYGPPRMQRFEERGADMLYYLRTCFTIYYLLTCFTRCKSCGMLSMLRTRLF